MERNPEERNWLRFGDDPQGASAPLGTASRKDIRIHSGLGMRLWPFKAALYRMMVEYDHHLRLPAVPVACSCCSASVDWWVRLRTHPDMPICHNCLAGLNGQRDGQLQLMTGRWLTTSFEPIFRVADIQRSVAWYERTGFETSMHDETYAFAHRPRDLTIHLAQVSGDELSGHGAIYLHCQDADRVAEEWRAAGIDVDGLRDESYGKREGVITDPDGNAIRFGGPIR